MLSSATDKRMKKLFSTLAIAALFAMNVAAEDAKFPTISTDDLKKAIEEKKVTLIDVNGTDSWKEGHIPGAIDFEGQQAKLAKMLPVDKNALIVAYCGNEACPAYKAGARAAKELGFKNVKHYAAGIQGWSKKEKTEKPSGS